MSNINARVGRTSDELQAVIKNCESSTRRLKKISTVMAYALMGSASVIALGVSPVLAQSVTTCNYTLDVGNIAEAEVANEILQALDVNGGVSLTFNDQFGNLVAVAPGTPDGTTVPATMGTTAAGGGLAASVTGGTSGPPSISVTQVSNSEALDEVRRRRETQVAMLAGATRGPTDLAPVQQNAPPSSPSSTSQSSAPAPKKKNTASQSSAPGTAADPVQFEDAPVPTGGTTIGMWTQAFGDYERHKNLAPGRANNTTRKQWTGGGFLGLDQTFDLSTNGYSQFLTMGLLAGGLSTHSKFSDTSTTTNSRASQKGGFVGAYAAFASGNFSFDLIFKTDLLQHRQKVTVSTVVVDADCPAANTFNNGNGGVTLDVTSAGTSGTNRVIGKVTQTNYNLGGNTQYRIQQDGNWWLEPTAGFLYTHTDYGSNASSLGLRDGKVFRIQGGARVGTDWNSGSQNWTMALLALAYSDVKIDGFILNSGGLTPSVSPVDEGELRGLARLEGSVSQGNGLSYNFQTEVRGGEDVIGLAGRIGARFEW